VARQSAVPSQCPTAVQCSLRTRSRRSASSHTPVVEAGSRLIASLPSLIAGHGIADDPRAPTTYNRKEGSRRTVLETGVVSYDIDLAAAQLGGQPTISGFSMTGLPRVRTSRCHGDRPRGFPGETRELVPAPAAADETARCRGEGRRHTPRYGDLHTASDFREARTEYIKLFERYSREIADNSCPERKAEILRVLRTQARMLPIAKRVP
jgi:hypothetical protein